MSVDPATIVGRSHLLTSRFGRWPSFHDAEIIEFSLNRGSLHLNERGPVLPFASVTIHHWRLTSDVDAKGYFVLDLHTVSTLRFHGISDLKIGNFNQQNVIFSLKIENEKRHPEDSFPIKVEFESSFGMEALIRCISVEVVESHASDDKGSLHPNRIAGTDFLVGPVSSGAGAAHSVEPFTSTFFGYTMTMGHIKRSFSVSLQVRHPTIDPEVIATTFGMIPPF